MFYTAIEDGDNLTVIDETESLFEATCSYYELVIEAENGGSEAIEVELGQYTANNADPSTVDWANADDMEPIVYWTAD
jgi:hypothetical protein